MIALSWNCLVRIASRTPISSETLQIILRLVHEDLYNIYVLLIFYKTIIDLIFWNSVVLEADEETFEKPVVEKKGKVLQNI